MDLILVAAILGGIGGATRAAVGLLKVISQKKKVIWNYWWATTLIAVMVGAMTGVIFDFDPRLSLLSGYAGTDLLEGIYKTFLAQKVYVVPKIK